MAGIQKCKGNQFRKLLIFILCISVFFNVLFFLVLEGYTLNVSPSIPLGIYKLSPITEPLQNGTLVEVQIPTSILKEMQKRHYKSENKKQYVKTFLKYIRGKEGDVFILQDSKLKNGKTIIKNGKKLGIAFNSDPQGQKFILPNSWKVEKGEYFIMGEHYRSYDSRYFGPIKAEYITRVAKPIFTW